MRKTTPLPAAASVALAVLLLAAAPAAAHFGMVIPSKPTVTDAADSRVDFEIKFWHPFENTGMTLVKPASFKVFSGGQQTDALAELKEKKTGDLLTWTYSWKASRPGLAAFVLEPQPYWEPAEDKFIVHYTKAYVDAFGDDEGWNEPLGLKTEIVPRAKPGAQYAGNTFTGKVLLDGKAVADGEVEVEWYPGADRKGDAPSESMVTQVVLTDENGNFAFTPPAAGWWGFAALSDADYKLQADGADKDVELGAVLWVYFHEFRPSAAAQ
jgi:cobalt/nickel transport protein